MIPYYDHAGITIYNGDCKEVLPTLPAGRYAFATDPPYGTGGWRRTEAGAGRNPSGSLVVEKWDDGAVDWLGLLPVEVCASFWPPARTMHLLSKAHGLGYEKHRALYMRKRDPKPMPGGRTRWSVEPIWVLSRDGFVLTGGDDVIEVSTPRMGRDADATGHPYEKPLEALTWLLAKLPADLTIVDPFLGSGTTAVACKQLGRRCVGVEMSAAYCAIAARRLSQEVLDLGEAA